MESVDHTLKKAFMVGIFAERDHNIWRSGVYAVADVANQIVQVVDIGFRVAVCGDDQPGEDKGVQADPDDVVEYAVRQPMLVCFQKVLIENHH